jgi:hypothetical protein
VSEPEEPLVPSRAALQHEYAGLRTDLRDLGARVDTVRTFAIAAVGAVLTLAIQQHLSVIAIGGMALAHCFALLDLTGASRYQVFAGRARQVELALDAYEDLERLEDDDATERLRDRLDGLDKRPLQVMLNEPGRHAMHFTYPRAVFRILYPALIAAGGVLAIGLQLKDGRAWTIAIVAGAVVAFWVVCAPRYLDPTKPPLFLWRRPGPSWRASRASGVVVLTFDVLALAIATFLVWGALRNPPSQPSGSLAVQAVPSVRALSVVLNVSPSCSSIRASLLVHWKGRASRLALALPANLRFADGDGNRRVIAAVHGASAMLQLAGNPSPTHGGRCTFALPSLVGAGQAQAGRINLESPTSGELDYASGLGYTEAGVIAVCTTATSPSPPLTCGMLLHVTEPGSGSERVLLTVIAALMVLFAVLLSAARLLAGALAGRQPSALGATGDQANPPELV